MNDDTRAAALLRAVEHLDRVMRGLASPQLTADVSAEYVVARIAGRLTMAGSLVEALIKLQEDTN